MKPLILLLFFLAACSSPTVDNEPEDEPVSKDPEETVSYWGHDTGQERVFMERNPKNNSYRIFIEHQGTLHGLFDPDHYWGHERWQDDSGCKSANYYVKRHGDTMRILSDDLCARHLYLTGGWFRLTSFPDWAYKTDHQTKKKWK